MFILNENGILISLDFSNITKKWQNENWWLNSIIFANISRSTTLIILTNIITVLIYFRFIRRTPEVDAPDGRTTEINQVLQDIIRLNNLQLSLGGNFQNLANGINNTGTNINQQMNLAPIPTLSVNNDNVQIMNENLNAGSEILNEDVNMLQRNEISIEEDNRLNHNIQT